MTEEISIIIPTYRRQESLRKLLRSLEADKRHYLEIIVVFQGERNTKRLRNVKVVYLDIPSTTHAMNVGVRKAKGDLILFLDDDVLARCGLIVNHIKNFSDPMVAATCGRVITTGQPVKPKYRNVGHVGPLGGVSDGFSSTIRQDVDTVIGCNTCWRKSVYKKLGGMDEQFTGNAIRLETDLSLRTKNSVTKLYLNPRRLLIT